MDAARALHSHHSLSIFIIGPSQIRICRDCYGTVGWARAVSESIWAGLGLIGSHRSMPPYDEWHYGSTLSSPRHISSCGAPWRGMIDGGGPGWCWAMIWWWAMMVVAAGLLSCSALYGVPRCASMGASKRELRTHP